MVSLATRMTSIGTETAFEVGARVSAAERQGKKIYKFHIGQPDFPTPENIKEGAKEALLQNKTGYTDACGTYEARKACADFASAMRGIQYTPEQTVVAPGAKPIIFAASFTLLNEGDEAIYPNPGFPIYESSIKVIGAKPIPLPLLEDEGFNFNVETLKESITPKTKLVFINTPQNPTGGVLRDDVLKAVRDLAMDHDFYVFSDEVYSCITYGKPFKSIASLEGMKDRTIVLDGHSKTYSMTGWRLGYGLMPESLAKAMTTLAINIYSCPSSIVQHAGIAALKGSQESVKKMVEEFRKRRDFIVSRLNKIDGVSCVMPEGAFYAFPNVKKVLARKNWTSNQLERHLLENGVSVLSGTAFGKYGEGYLRFSYANSMSELEAGLNRVEETFEKLKA